MRFWLLFATGALLAVAADERAVRDFIHSRTFKAAPNYAESCPSTDLALGSTIEGSLSLTDCSLRLFNPNAAVGIRADAYKIVAESNLIVQVNIQSTDIEPDVYILNADGQPIAGDTSSETDKQAKTIIHLEPGTYTILATSFIAGTGTYKITATADVPRSCAFQPLTPGETIEGSFSDSDCRLIDLAPYETELIPLDGYVLEIGSRKALGVTYSSTTAPGLIAVFDSANQVTTNSGDVGLNVQTLSSVLPGKYFVFVAAGDGRMGAYKLKAAVDNLRECASAPLNPGETVNGQLGAEDCRDLDIFVPGDDPSPTDPWKIEVPDRTFVTLTMRSNVFDTYLSLTGKDNKLFGSNDDFEDLTYDSQIRISLNPGTYSALSSTVDDAGPYTLTLNSEPLRTCDVPDLGTGPTTGSVTTEDCRVLDLVVPSTDSKVTDAYRLRVSAKTVYTFELSSTNFTPAIRVYDGTNTLVFSRAASTTAKALKLDVLLWAGDYTVLIVSQDRPGDYTLTTSKREPPTCEATVIPLNGSTEGRLVASDCRLADVLSGVFSTSKTDVLKLVVPEKRAVTIAADSDSFPPLLVVYNEADLLVGSALNQSLRTHAELTATLPAGTYTIVIANVLGLEGPYVVKTTSPEP